MGLAFLITSDALQLMSERKVLKEAEYKALLDASAVIDAAREEARRLVTQSEQRAEATRRKSYLEGQAQARAEHAQRMMSDAAVAETQLLAMRTAMANIVVKAVSQLLTEVDPRALFEAALQKVDELVHAETFVTITVAPQSEASLLSALEQLKASGKWTTHVSVTTDPALPKGTCKLRTTSGVVEIGLDAQIKLMRKMIEQRLMSNHG